MEKSNYTEFGTIKNSAGSNNFVLSVKNWIEASKAIRITAKPGRYGGISLSEFFTEFETYLEEKEADAAK